MVTGHLREPPLNLEPDRHWIDADVLPGDARHEDVRSMLVVDDPPKHRGHLQPPLLVDPGGRAASQPLLVHLSPLKSTRIVERDRDAVNRKMLIPYGLRVCFALVSTACIFAKLSFLPCRMEVWLA